jgi:hypothetical protein
LRSLVNEMTENTEVGRIPGRIPCGAIASDHGQTIVNRPEVCAWYPLEGGQQLAVLCVPEPRGFVVGGCDNALPIGAELGAVHGALMTLEGGYGKRKPPVIKGSYSRFRGRVETGS